MKDTDDTARLHAWRAWWRKQLMAIASEPEVRDGSRVELPPATPPASSGADQQGPTTVGG